MTVPVAVVDVDVDVDVAGFDCCATGVLLALRMRRRSATDFMLARASGLTAWAKGSVDGGGCAADCECEVETETGTDDGCRGFVDGVVVGATRRWGLGC